MRYCTEWPLCRASLRRRSIEGDDDLSTASATDDEEQIPRLLTVCKAHVPHVMKRVGENAWRLVVDSDVAGVGNLHPPGHAISRSYYKFLEIFGTCALPVPRRSLHLCEAPGGFVQCLGDLIRSSSIESEGSDLWTWKALSLPSSEASPPLPPPPTFSTRRLPLSRGEVHLVDVHDTIACRRRLHESGMLARSCDLVTADGAVASDHTILETTNHTLCVSELRIALEFLADGGSLIMKFFEGFRDDTLEWIALVSVCFDRVSLLKPLTSRATNSERYLVGTGFRWCEYAEYADVFDPVTTDRVSSRVFVSPDWKRHTKGVVHRLAHAQILALRTAFDRLGCPLPCSTDVPQ
jgi:23S rRNA U2552 (ribose-2'-O)-methylase RlmE/FtsJ